MTFAIITPTLIIGVFIERARFSFVVLFSAIRLVLVYLPVAHWVWDTAGLARRDDRLRRQQRRAHDGGDFRTGRGDHGRPA